MEVTTSGLPIVGDTTDFSWVGNSDCELMLRQSGFNPTKSMRNGTNMASITDFDGNLIESGIISCPKQYLDIAYEMLYTQLAVDLALKGNWFKGWSKDAIYYSKDKDGNEVSCFVYPKHLRDKYVE